MTARRRRVTAAVVLAVYLTCLVVALGAVTDVALVATFARAAASTIVGASRSVGLLTLSDGFVQALAVSAAVVPVLPLVALAAPRGHRGTAGAVAVGAVLVASVVVALTTSGDAAVSSGGAGATGGRLASLLWAAAVGLALGLLVARAAVVVGSPTPVGTPERRVRAGAIAAAVVYALVLASIAFTARPVDEGFGPTLQRGLDVLHGIGVPVWVDYSTVEFTANIALFVPLGVVVVLLVGLDRWWWGAVAGLVASSTIELGQLVFLPGRFASADDVLANTTGAVIGALVGVVVLDVVHRRAASRA